MTNKENHLFNYYCTWRNQVLTSDGTTTGGRDHLNHEMLFGENGLCSTLYPNERDSLIFLLDDGWELPYSNGDSQNHNKYYGSQRIFEDKFPGYGDTPPERLKTMVGNIKSYGWAGVGIWICANEEEEVFKNLKENAWSEDYWIERLNWSKYAGIAYWKIDWGHYCFNNIWRRKISELANEIYPDLIIEHCDPEQPLSDPFGSGRLTKEKLKINADCLSYSDIYRTYDVSTALSVATTFDRIGELLCVALPQENSSLGIINAEDELYMCVALGTAFGVMRYPQSDSAQDEVSRAVKFSKMAPPFPAFKSKDKISSEWLEDSWFFNEEDTWQQEAIGHTIKQCAPSSIARNTRLPEVKANVQKPFISVCKNPNGVYSIGAYPRTMPDLYRKNYLAEVTVFAEDSNVFGIFGEYKELKITLNHISKQARVLASDILSEELIDITDKIKINDNILIISGELIHNIGLSCASSGDTSEPGMLLKIVE